MEERTVITDDELVSASIDVAARAIGVPPTRLIGWVERGLIDTQWQQRVGGNRRRVWAFSFDALVFGRIIRTLESDHDIHITQITKLVEVMRGWTLGLDEMHRLKWAVAPGEVFIQHPDGAWHGGRVPGQSVAIEVLDVHDIVADTRMRLARPVALAGKVERRRGVKHSQEVFAGTGITTATVEEYLDAGLDDERILRSFPTLYPADVALIRARRREPAPA